MLPVGIDWNETIGAVYRYGDHDGSKRRMWKEKMGRRNRGFSIAAGAHYEANLTCFFNPTEYAAFMSFGNDKHFKNTKSLDREDDTEAICDTFAKESELARKRMQQYVTESCVVTKLLSMMF